MSDQNPTTNDPITLEMGGLTIRSGEFIGPYRYERPIGKGGMALVVLARDPDGDPVALKILKATRFKTGLPRFRREFRALVKVRHPNVIAVESYGDIHGHPYIAMEYVEGTDLHKTIRGFRELLPSSRWRRVEQILADMSQGLKHIHARGLIHRDLKPSNVLIDSTGRCYITDFGIVKLIDTDTEAHVSTTLVGTWAYASPEQISGREIDHRSDLYSLGVILYAMLTGRRPFSAKSMADYLNLHQRKAPRPPSQLYPAVPRELEEICLRLLAKAPRDRFQSADELLIALGHSRPAMRVPDNVPMSWTPPMVGRKDVTGKLELAVSSLTRREGGVLLMHGAEGTGKTRLLSYARRYARSLGIPTDALHLNANEGAMDAAIRLGKRYSRDLGGIAPPVLTASIEEFSSGSARSDQDLRYKLFDALRDTLHVLLANQPRLIIIDNLHLAPQPIMTLLGYLVRTIPAQQEGLLIIAAARDDLETNALRWVASDEELGFLATDVPIQPLSANELRRLVQEMLGKSRDTNTLAARLWRETEGNPLFIVEFIRSLIQQGTILRGDRGDLQLSGDIQALATGELEIPPGVRQVVESRLKPLGPADRNIIAVVAVAGQPVEIDVLLDVVGGDEEDTLDRIERLTAEGLLEARQVGMDPLFDFSHRKYGEVLLQSMTRNQRTQRHRKLAQVLEDIYGDRPASAQLIGEQYRQAGDAPSAWRHLAQAAHYLHQNSLMAEAAILLERLSPLEESARALLPPDVYAQHRRNLLYTRGEILLNQGAWQQAAGTLRALLLAARQAGDWQQAAQGELKLATALRRLGEREASEQLTRSVLQRARARADRAILIDALHHLAASAWEEGDLDRCERLAGQGLIAASGPALSGSRAQILIVLTTMQAMRGQLDAATIGMSEADGILKRLNRKRLRTTVLNNLAEMYVWQGRLTAALDKANEARKLSHDLLHIVNEGNALRTRAWARMETGDLVGADADLSRCLLLSEELSLAEDIVSTRYFYGLLSIRREQVPASRVHLQAGLIAARQQDPELYAPLLQALLAWCWCSLGREPVARKLLGNLQLRLPSLPNPRRSEVCLWMAQTRMLLGERSAALTLAQEADRLSDLSGLRLTALRAKGLLCQLVSKKEAPTIATAGLELLHEIEAVSPPEASQVFRREAPIIALLENTT